jgi:hypothetical protein
MCCVKKIAQLTTGVFANFVEDLFLGSVKNFLLAYT